MAETKQQMLSDFTNQNNDTPIYRDGSWLWEKYHKEDLTTPEMAELAECDPSTIRKWMDRNGIEIYDGNYPPDAPFKDADWLREQHWNQEKSIRQIARECDAPYATIRHWFDKLEVDTRTRKDAINTADIDRPDGRDHHRWQEYAAFGHAHRGWEAWRYTRPDGEGSSEVLVHRLLAVAEYGFDEVCGAIVHHKNQIPWDNRPENIELTDPVQHPRLHHE